MLVHASTDLHFVTVILSSSIDQSCWRGACFCRVPMVDEGEREELKLLRKRADASPQ
jgi:hypothetical protein